MKKIVILGSGESGVGAAILAKRLGYDVFVSDKSAIQPRYITELEAHGIEFEMGQHSLPRLEDADLVLKSPGIPNRVPVLAALRAKKIPIIGEIEFAWSHMGPCSLIAITGSNGKTTTTSLTYHLLHTAGLPVRMAGNVGYSFARYIAEDIQNDRINDKSRIFVLEISSFQLEDTVYFRPDIAILLNITPDHLDRYDYKMELYAEAKFRITANQKTGDVFIYNAFDSVISDYLHQHPLNELVKNIPVRKGFDQGRMLQIDFENGFDMQETKLIGPHNRFNAACAVRAGMLLGLTDEEIQNGLITFNPPPHRLEKVAVLNGITYINDSKATNVDSVFYALQAMENPTVWIVGGQDKGNDYKPLLPLIQKKVKSIVCLGADNSKLAEAFSITRKPLVETRSAQAAVSAATQLAEPGDTVLLSPACASFDLFMNYEDRGDQFRQAVFQLNTK